MTSALVKPEASATITVTDPVELTIEEGKVTLDDGWSPYIQATFDVPLTGPDLVEQIDPNTDQRVVVTASETIGGSSRTFDLGLRKRTANHRDQLITIELASDEALLMDKKRLAATVDATPRTHEASLRAICDWALDKIGASLESGPDDADLTAYWTLRNLFGDASANDTDWFAAGAGASALTTVSSPTPPFGANCLRWTADAGDSNLALSTGGKPRVSVTPGRPYTISCYLRSSTARNATLYQRFYDAEGVLISTVPSSTVATSTSVWTRFSVTAIAPANSTNMRPYVGTVSNTGGQFHYIDGILFTEGAELVPYFNGGTTNDANYTYTFEGDVNESSSIRTAVVERPPELFNWRPGASLWDFLQPLFEASGLRLFCDEQRAWRLVDPTTYEVPGSVLVQEKANATKGEDTIDRNAEGLGVTGVVAAYKWFDALGIQREAFDYAGSDENVYTVEYEREYTGPGAAAYVLARMQGMGRTQDVERLIDFTATPGMGTTINLPGALPQSGRLTQVVFDMKTGLMELGTRGLIGIEPGSWDDWDDAEFWDDVDGAVTWDSLV